MNPAPSVTSRDPTPSSVHSVNGAACHHRTRAHIRVPTSSIPLTTPRPQSPRACADTGAPPHSSATAGSAATSASAKAIHKARSQAASCEERAAAQRERETVQTGPQRCNPRLERESAPCVCAQSACFEKVGSVRSVETYLNILIVTPTPPLVWRVATPPAGWTKILFQNRPLLSKTKEARSCLDLPSSCCGHGPRGRKETWQAGPSKSVP